MATDIKALTEDFFAGRIKPDEFLGSGYYSNVYALDCAEDCVIKIRNEDPNYSDTRVATDSWLFWALYCIIRNHELSVMPRIHALVINFREAGYAAIMERCSRTNKTYGVSSRSIEEDLLKMNVSEEQRYDALRAILEFREWYSTTFKIFDDNIYLDTHGANWMDSADDQLRLTDPYDTSLDRSGYRAIQGRLINWLMQNPLNNVRIIW